MKKINIKGPIIPSNHQWIYDWLDIEATSPKKVNEQLEAANGENVEIYINSGGGSVYDASEIYTAIKEYSGKTVGKIVGLAASAASFAAMATDELLITPTGQMMIHNAKTRAEGDYRDMDHTSDFLKKVNKSIANAYRLKSGKSYEELLSMMNDETWLTAQEAKEHNLVDGIMFEDDVQVVANTDDAGGLLPQQVIDKIRNELMSNAPQNQVVVKPPIDTGVNTKNQKEDKNVMDLEKLKNDYPELYEQVKNEGFEAGVKAENSRIKAIEDLGVPGSEELVNKAKFEIFVTAEQLAVEIVKAQKQQGINFLENRNNEAKELDGVKGSEAPENNGSEDVEMKETASLIANFINKKRGGNQ